ncbi:hypothetical protein [Kitasatospora purpeofusca]|uniref:hypothetical protein n=1 Tax=Kitasatospora purpeofusca TaxID=67352 RepID=UPI00381C340E
MSQPARQKRLPSRTVDALALQVAALANGQRHHMASWILKTVHDAVNAHPLPAGCVLDPPAAGEYFGRVRQHVEAQIAAMTQSYPSVQWLWYLRRLPDLFDGRLATTGPSDRALMELMAATSTRDCSELPTTDGQIVFPVTDGVIRRVLRLSAMTIVLSEIHSKLRRAGKGTSFRAGADGLPEAIPKSAVDQAIALYDLRVAEGEDGLLAPGARILSADLRTGDPAPIFTVNELPAWQDLPAFYGPLKDNAWLTVRGRFVPHVSSIAALPEVLAGVKRPTTGWWHPSFPAVLTLLQALYWYLQEFTGVGGLSIIRYGYLTMPRQILQEVVDEALPALQPRFEKWFPGSAPAVAAEVFDGLESLNVALWPNEPGPVLHPAGDDVLIDVACASRHLIRMCTIAPDGGGPLPNARADRFETDVQHLLDNSAWKPGSGLVPGMKPDPDGSGPITDLDAVGENGTTLLVVSCKSVPYNYSYDAGVFRTVNNVASMIDKAVAKWDSVVQTLTDTPVGRNYDLSRFQRIVGIVCLPHVPYTLIGPATETVATGPDGSILRRVCSYSELHRWLQSHS